jgi:hypothetical protein
MAIWSFLSMICEFEKYWMGLWARQTRLKFPGFVHFLQVKTIECESAKLIVFLGFSEDFHEYFIFTNLHLFIKICTKPGILSASLRSP